MPARARFRSVLVQLSGVPGSGKSTLARSVAGATGFVVVDTDVLKSRSSTPAYPWRTQGASLMPLPWPLRGTCLCRVEACSWTRHAGIKSCSIPVVRSLERTGCVMHSSSSGSGTGQLCCLVSMRDRQGFRRWCRQRHRFVEPSGSAVQPKRRLRPGRRSSFVQRMTGFDSMPRVRRI